MAENTCKDLVIIGGGPAGLSAAIYAQRAMLDAVTLEQQSFGGQVIQTSEVDNYPGVPHTDGFSLIEAMRTQAEDLGAELSIASVTSIIEAGDEGFTVGTSEGDIATRAVILAAGAVPRHAGFEGEEAYVGRGVSYCATCDGMFYRGRDVFVIGGGNSAVEEALFLTRFARHITLVVRKDHMRAQQTLVREFEANAKTSVRYLTSITKVAGTMGITEVTFRNNEDGSETTETFETPVGVFVFVGRVPASELVRDLVDVTPTGFVKTDVSMATKTPGLFAAGDVRDTPLRQIVCAASDGAIAATSTAAFLGQHVFD
ncbi:MAG: FAD-dependent oxidoreductase [Atopobiaceae bacterium]|nr:FAD-dependent oxidoreductase [Atopobiaceae bacterium]